MLACLCGKGGIVQVDLHPTDILNDLNIVQGCLLELKKLGRLLESALEKG